MTVDFYESGAYIGPLRDPPFYLISQDSVRVPHVGQINMVNYTVST